MWVKNCLKATYFFLGREKGKWPDATGFTNQNLSINSQLTDSVCCCPAVYLCAFVLCPKQSLLMELCVFVLHFNYSLMGQVPHKEIWETVVSCGWAIRREERIKAALKYYEDKTVHREREIDWTYLCLWNAEKFSFDKHTLQMKGKCPHDLPKGQCYISV